MIRQGCGTILEIRRRGRRQVRRCERAHQLFVGRSAQALPCSQHRCPPDRPMAAPLSSMEEGNRCRRRDSSSLLSLLTRSISMLPWATIISTTGRLPIPSSAVQLRRGLLPASSRISTTSTNISRTSIISIRPIITTSTRITLTPLRRQGPAGHRSSYRGTPHQERWEGQHTLRGRRQCLHRPSCPPPPPPLPLSRWERMEHLRRLKTLAPPLPWRPPLQSPPASAHLLLTWAPMELPPLLQMSSTAPLPLRRASRPSRLPVGPPPERLCR
mmetsp:Transcript_39138/g.117660  ORF Transcript_39138/g.117660 Transcript_39138/m.117660 type:complete len:271 (+) Transcript_39138:420-1232(+)